MYFSPVLFIWHVLQLAFTEEGLNELWNELVKDNEITSEVVPFPASVSTSVGGSGRDRESRQSRDSEEDGEREEDKGEEEQDKEKRSGFMPILEEWTWGEVSRKGERVTPITPVSVVVLGW